MITGFNRKKDREPHGVNAEKRLGGRGEITPRKSVQNGLPSHGQHRLPGNHSAFEWWTGLRRHGGFNQSPHKKICQKADEMV